MAFAGVDPATAVSVISNASGSSLQLSTRIPNEATLRVAAWLRGGATRAAGFRSSVLVWFWASARSVATWRSCQASTATGSNSTSCARCHAQVGGIWRACDSSATAVARDAGRVRCCMVGVSVETRPREEKGKSSTRNGHFSLNAGRTGVPDAGVGASEQLDCRRTSVDVSAWPSPQER